MSAAVCCVAVSRLFQAVIAKLEATKYQNTFAGYKILSQIDISTSVGASTIFQLDFISRIDYLISTMLCTVRWFDR